MQTTHWLRGIIFSTLLSIMLAAFTGFIAWPSRANAATSHTSDQFFMLVKTPDGSLPIPIDGKPHLVQQIKHACPQNSSGCIAQFTVMAKFASQAPGARTNNLARPLYACPSYIDTYNYTDDYSDWFSIHYWHIELDTEELINPCYATITHIYTDPWCEGYNGYWCDASSNNSYWDPAHGEQDTWYSQNMCTNTFFGTSCETTRLQTNIAYEGNVFCHDQVGSDSATCGPNVT